MCSALLYSGNTCSVCLCFNLQCNPVFGCFVCLLSCTGLSSLRCPSFVLFVDCELVFNFSPSFLCLVKHSSFEKVPYELKFLPRIGRAEEWYEFQWVYLVTEGDWWKWGESRLLEQVGGWADGSERAGSLKRRLSWSIIEKDGRKPYSRKYNTATQAGAAKMLSAWLAKQSDDVCLEDMGFLYCGRWD